jgi:hypothetical protein
MIQVRPYDDRSAMAVLQVLDIADAMEVNLVRGQVTDPLALFADWRTLQTQFLASFIAQTRGGTPFAVFGLSPTGQAGVACAALLARDHARYRRPLAELALQVRALLPQYCRDTGLRRIEARTWAQHPTASGLLTGLGFCYEMSMRGFGPSGATVFDQYAYLTACTPPGPQEQAHVF